MKKTMIFLMMAALISMTVAADDFGSTGADKNADYTLEEMFRYALEDEHMALAEYEALMEEFNVTRPYSNIAESEKTHITYLEELYAAYGFDMPEIDTESRLVLPATLLEAAEIGVQAEIANIAMYENFLATDLPADVAEVFEDLMKGSEKHLSAFERQVERSTSASSRGNGRNRRS